MSPDTRSLLAPFKDAGPRSQRGVGLPAAIFVITVMVVIATGINQLVIQNSDSFEEQTLMARAFYAAESGAGLGMSKLFPPNDFPAYGTRASCAAAPWVLEFTQPGLSACRVDVTCSLDATADGLDYFTITSAGQCEDITRTVQVRTSYEAP